MKRLYREVAVVAAGDRFGIALDGKPVRTPAGRDLAIPTRALAAAIAEEWSGQGERVVPVSMPLMQLMATALDRVAAAPADAVTQLVRYAETDLLCYRAVEPAELVARQAAMWQPLVDWAGLRYGAALTVTAGLMPAAQPEATLAALRTALDGLDAPALTGLLSATGAAGSLLLALALREGRISAEEAWALSQLDETFQIERWGEDAEAAQRRAVLRADLAVAGRFMSLAAAP